MIEQIKKLTQELTILAEKSDTKLALAKINTFKAEVEDVHRKEALLSIPTPEELRKEWGHKPLALESYYLIGEGKQQQRLKFPAGAITYVAAPTSHRKTGTLINFLIDAMLSPSEGISLFFTFEESASDIYKKIINAYANLVLGDNNIEVIDLYYNSGCDISILPEKVREQYLIAEDYIMKAIQQGRIRVFDRVTDRDIADLVGDIRTIAKNTKIKAVFLDYVQCLKKRDYRGTDKKGIMAEICDDLKALSVELGRPFIVSAQVNRAPSSPLEIEIQDIADASEIEHSASQILLLWDSANPARCDSKRYYADKERKQLTAEAAALEKRGLTLGQPGAIYCQSAKNRSGVRYLSAVWKVTPLSGRITNLDCVAESMTSSVSNTITQDYTPTEGNYFTF